MEMKMIELSVSMLSATCSEDWTGSSHVSCSTLEQATTCLAQTQARVQTQVKDSQSESGTYDRSIGVSDFTDQFRIRKRATWRAVLRRTV